MDKELLNSFAKTMIELLQNTKDFLKEQVPEVCKEVLNYNLYESVYELIFLSICLYIIWRTYKWLIKKCEEEDALYILWFFIVGGSLFSVASICYCVETIIKIEFAPRIFLLEYFKHLL